MEKSANQILNEAADLLEEEGKWGQGQYFKFPKQDSSPACVMCAHGAIAYCGSNKVKELILKVDNAAAAAGDTIDAVFDNDELFRALEGTASRAAASKGISVLEYIRQHPEYYGDTPELAYAHYLAAKAGLTFAFNDAPGRTKQEVIDKLREAALNG